MLNRESSDPLGYSIRWGSQASISSIGKMKKLASPSDEIVFVKIASHLDRVMIGTAFGDKASIFEKLTFEEIIEYPVTVFPL